MQTLELQRHWESGLASDEGVCEKARNPKLAPQPASISTTQPKKNWTTTNSFDKCFGINQVSIIPGASSESPEIPAIKGNRVLIYVFLPRGKLDADYAAMRVRRRNRVAL